MYSTNLTHKSQVTQRGWSGLAMSARRISLRGVLLQTHARARTAVLHADGRQLYVRERTENENRQKTSVKGEKERE